MTETESYDAVIIGTGQAGKPLADALAEEGWRVAIVERDRVGGTCIISGCTPTKTMIASARVAHLARRAADYGVETGPVSVDLEVVRSRKRKIVDDWSRSNAKHLEEHDRIDLVRGEARFASPNEILVSGEGGARRLEGRHVFINAGARPSVPPIEGLDTVPFLDSTSVMELGDVPGRLLILGGGFIGLEFGQMFRRFGARVTIMEATPRIAGPEDEDVSEALTEILRDDGIDVRTDFPIERVEGSDEGVAVTAEGGERVEGTHLLVAAGRQPNTNALALDEAGLEPDKRGFIPVDDRCRTSVDGVWALGDVTGAPPFTHIAYDDFRVVRSQLLGDGSVTRKDRPLPYVVFTDPQLGRVGLTEAQAREDGYDVKVATLPMSKVARAIEVDETRGFMKAVVDASNDRILGVAILGIEGGEVASVLQTAMMGDLPYTALRDGVFSHPTLSESLNNLFATLD